MRIEQRARMENNSLILFKQYYEANVSPLISFAKRFVSSDAADDIVHDVFLKIWDNIDVFDEMPPPSYLFMAVRNRCLNVLKREQVKDNYMQSTELDNKMLALSYYDSYEKTIIDRENMKIIYDEIERLPEKCRVIFTMSYIEEKKNQEIAELLNLSIRTVEHQLYLGLRMLRDRLTSRGKRNLFFLLFI